MTLIECRDCEKEMSKRAYFCPHCGGLTKFGYPALILLGAVSAFIVLAAAKYVFFSAW